MVDHFSKIETEGELTLSADTAEVILRTGRLLSRAAVSQCQQGSVTFLSFISGGFSISLIENIVP